MTAEEIQFTVGLVAGLIIGAIIFRIAIGVHYRHRAEEKVKRFQRAVDEQEWGLHIITEPLPTMGITDIPEDD